MPRKTRKPRKAALSPVTQDTLRRLPELKATPRQAFSRLDRSARQSKRPPRFPGRLGGR